jgi:hypothetical protein
MVNLLDLPRLNEEELEMCRKAFQLFDKDGEYSAPMQSVVITRPGYFIQTLAHIFQCAC